MKICGGMFKLVLFLISFPLSMRALQEAHKPAFGR